MILLCGATGEVGGRVAVRLSQRGASLRALVRPSSDASALESLGIRVVRGDVSDPGSLGAALAGVDTVVTTVNSVGRLLAGDRTVSITAVDRDGNAALVQAAEQAGVERFVFVSSALYGAAASVSPFAAAKVATESLLRESPMREVLVRSDLFQEAWLSALAGVDPARGRAVIFGRGRTPVRYVAQDDVAELAAQLAVEPDPPRVVDFGGPEVMTRLDVVSAIEQASGRRMRHIYIPEMVMDLGARLVRPMRPEMASVMGLALASERTVRTWDDAALRERGIAARPVSQAIAAMGPLA